MGRSCRGHVFADNVQGPDGNPVGARFTMYLPVHRGEMPRADVTSGDAKFGGYDCESLRVAGLARSVLVRRCGR